MSDSVRADALRSYKDEAYDMTAGDAVDADEEAQLISREELEFDDNDQANQSAPKRSAGCLGFLSRPQPPHPQKIKPFFPSIQEGPARFLKWLFHRQHYQNFFLNAILVVWLVVFVGFLATQLPTNDGDGKPVINLDCTDSLWKRKNGCGIDGVDCRPFNNTSFAFRCPSKCTDVQLLNPHAVGALDVNYRPLVIGTDISRGDSFVCASAIHAGVIDSREGGCGRINLVGQHSNFPSTRGHDLESIPFDSSFPLSFTFPTITPDDKFKCNSEPRIALLFVSFVTTTILSIFSTKSNIFFPIFFIIFAHVSFVSDPPQASYRNTTVLFDHLSMFAKRLLPAFFVAA